MVFFVLTQGWMLHHLYPETMSAALNHSPYFLSFQNFTHEKNEIFPQSVGGGFSIPLTAGILRKGVFLVIALVQ